MTLRHVISLVAAATLAGCVGTSMGTADRSSAVLDTPALDVLALDFERTIVEKGAVVRGRIARAQAKSGLANSTSGLLRRAGTGPIPVEVQVQVDRMSTSRGQVRMSGTLVLRDLGLGTVLATNEDFSGSGPMPIIEPGGRLTGLVFRGVEDEIIEWIAGLACDTAARVCGPAPEPIEPEAVEEDLELASMMVGRRPGAIRQLNTGGIDPGQVVAAAGTPTASTAEGLSQIGTTVAALGPLDRSGFWLRTPLVEEEGEGEVRDPSSGKRQIVTLLPSDGPEGGGSQASLALLSALGVEMTALITLDVFR